MQFWHKYEEKRESSKSNGVCRNNEKYTRRSESGIEESLGKNKETSK